MDKNLKIARLILKEAINTLSLAQKTAGEARHSLIQSACDALDRAKATMKEAA